MLFQPLPAETVYEARKKSLRDSRLLFCLLVVIYLLCFNLGAWLVLDLPAWYLEGRISPYPSARVLAISSLIAVAAAAFQFYLASRTSLDRLLRQIQARPADPEDALHQGFLDLVREVEAASGVRPIRAMVLSSPVLNAFALQDGWNSSAIGVTEGLLARLDREELAAVVCHEAAHLCHRDSRLNTMARGLVEVFDGALTLISAAEEEPGRRSGISAPGAMLYMVAALGRGLTRLVNVVLSREREFLADAQAVKMSQNPLGLARALRKISRHSGRVPALPPGFGASFFVDPTASAFDAGENRLADLFATHPPVKRRLEKLMPWCKLSLEQFEKAQSRLKQTGPSLPVMQKTGSGLDCSHCKVVLEQWQYEGARVWRCPTCKGNFMKPGILERLIARQWLVFSEEDAARARAWRDGQKGTLKDRGQSMPGHTCPRCRKTMGKVLYSMFTQVVVERCPNQACRSVWCEAGKLEVMQALVQGGNELT